MTRATSDQDLIAAFVARAGVRRIPEGQGLGLDARDWRAIVRGEPSRLDAERQSERYMEGAREAYHTGGRAGVDSFMRGEG